jgi:hypothetical protein
MTSHPPTLHAPAPLAACRLALHNGLLASAPHSVLDENGYVGAASQNLIEGVRLEDFEVDLLQGDGNELKGKFRAAHSSSALAVNTFAPFKTHLDALRLPGGSGFDYLHFEQKCPHGLLGRRSPLRLQRLSPGALPAGRRCRQHAWSHPA